MHSVALGMWHFADDRQPHIVLGKEVIHLAGSAIGKDEFKRILGREQYCAANFVPRCKAVQPDGAINVYRLHETLHSPAVFPAIFVGARFGRPHYFPRAFSNWPIFFWTFPPAFSSWPSTSKSA